MKKVLLCFCGMLILIIIIFLIYFNFRPQSIPVLAYHDFDLAENINYKKKNMFVDSVDNFEKQMKYIYKNNYKTLSMEEFYCWKKRKCELPKKSVLITFDDGYKSIYEHVYPILKKYNLKGTSFIIGDTITEKAVSNGNYLSWEEIEEIQKDYSDLEFHSHTYGLHKKDGNIHYVKLKSNKELKKDTQKINSRLDTNYIAYPYGAHTDEYIKILKEQDYKLGFIYYAPFIRAKKEHNDFQVPRVTIDSTIQYWRFKFALKVGLPSKTNLLLK